MRFYICLSAVLFAAPTAKDKVAAQSAASAKAYKVFQTAIMKGGKAGIIKGVDPGKASKVDTPEFPQILKMIRSVQPKDIEALQATETGELAVTGGGKETGTVNVRKLNGNSAVRRESWKQR